MALQFILLLLLLVLLPSLSSSLPQNPQQQLLLDKTTLNSALHFPPIHHRRTAVPYPVRLPSNLSSSSSISAHSVRFRSGSLRRRGARFEEITFPRGTLVRPRVRRLLVVQQNLGNASSLYYYVSGYRLVSPVIGLLLYPTRLEISTRTDPVKIDFSRLVPGGARVPGGQCACFGLDGTVRVIEAETDGGSGEHVCSTWEQGHYGIVVREEEEGRRRRDAGGIWRVVVVGVVGGGFGAVMVGLVVVAVAGVRRKGRAEAAARRRAYEDEALRVSMVGHVRAPVAGAVRTPPAVENDYGFEL